MAGNKITGRMIALSPVKEIAGNDPQRAPMKKRELWMDCTRFDPYTGERSQYENKPLLELGGDKLLQKVEGLNLQKGDIVAVSFDVQGVQYTEKATGKMRVFTTIRVYDVEKVREAATGTQQVVQHPVAPPQFVPQQSKDDDMPF